MLKKENRLKSQGEFSRVLKEGKRFSGQFLLIAAADPKEKHPRVGVVVSKKVEKKAVHRNRLRRIVAHVFEHLIKESPPKADVVIIIRSKPEAEAFAALERDIKKWRAAFSPSS
ncbi:MAG: ribonuclease P protein component [Candidatus Berkelbacteria bacterium]|nr:MAG: ribonuclease P protein component [Candidatus Berkelbacteria bacterium]QQG51717.1 MAG: ribonuclease P protein component [Candidatus Berkelbacteria bacterium]